MNVPKRRWNMSTKPIAEKESDEDSLTYDRIRMEEPKAGQRIAKLRAEIHMCRVVLVGVVLFGIYPVIPDWGCGKSELPIYFVLISSLCGAIGLYIHLRIRCAEQMENVSKIMNERSGLYL